MRWLAAVLALFLLWPAEDGDAWRLMAGGASTAPPAYVGPVDVITGGAATAYATDRAMLSSYVGNTLQLVRPSDNATLNLGQAGDRTTDMSGIGPFCKGAAGTGDLCDISIIYDEIGSSNMLPSHIAAVGPGSNCTASTWVCAPPYWVDPYTGLPTQVTPFPSQMYIDSNASLISHGHAMTVMGASRNDWHSENSPALMGVSHSATSCCTGGTSFGIGFFYNTSGHVSCLPHNLNVFCFIGAYEVPYGDSVQIGATTQIRTNEFNTFDGMVAQGGTFNAIGIVNGVTLWNGLAGATLGNVPPTFNMNPGTATSFSGGGGDNTHSDIISYHGIVTNTYVSTVDEAAWEANNNAFYAGRSPHPCQSTADMGYYFVPLALISTAQPISNALWAVGGRQMRASYWYSIADFRDSAGTVRTFAAADTGCGIDPAAATFCAANPPCTWAKAYNQGTYQPGPNAGNLHDGNLDMTAASVPAQPQAVFSTVGGATVVMMRFAGSQKMCTPNFGTPTYGVGATSRPALEMVASRTGSFTTAMRAVSSANSTELGYAASANTAVYQNGVGNNVAGVSDSHFHSLYEEMPGGANISPYLDGVALTPLTTGGDGTMQQQICVGDRSTGGFAFVGDLAEAALLSPVVSTGFASPYPALFPRLEVAWGTLPSP